MAYHFRNLVFEGGGIKGIAYVGAMKVLKDEGIPPYITRVGGTSAGAINATLFALGFTTAQTRKILKTLDINKFADDSWGILRDTNRLVSKFGWNKGDYFHTWIGKHVKSRLGSPNATFRDLKNADNPDLYVYGTNLSTRFGEVFSFEHTPTVRIADAVRISMSVPLFFTAIRNAREDVYVDGGVLNNYPVKLFDRRKYVSRAKMARTTDYYEKENTRFIKRNPASSPYIYNRETLRLRLNSKQEIGAFPYGKEPAHYEINNFIDYIKALTSTILNSQGNMHLHRDDWHRTLYIDSKGVGTTDIDISEAKKKALEKSGHDCAMTYFKWFNDKKSEPIKRL